MSKISSEIEGKVHNGRNRTLSLKINQYITITGNNDSINISYLARFQLLRIFFFFKLQASVLYQLAHQPHIGSVNSKYTLI